MPILKQSIYVSHIIETFLIVSNNYHIVWHNDFILALIVFGDITIVFQRLCHLRSQFILQLVPIIRATNQFPIQLLVKISRQE